MDATTIQVVHMGLSTKDPTKTYNCTILAKDGGGKFYVYYYAFLFPQEEYRYVVQGSKIKLSNGKSLDYSNGTITENNNVYIKLK